MSTARWFSPAAALCFLLSLSLSQSAQLLSLDQTGTRSGNLGVGESFAISSDGRFVAFSSEATNHVANDTNRVSDLFVHDCVLRRHIWDTTHGLHYPMAGVFRGSTPWSFTADGRYLLFTSTATNLVPGFTFNSNSGSQLYVQDLLSNVTTLITVAYDGTNLDGSAFPPPGSRRRVSSDGRLISFSSTATNLVLVQDANGPGSDIFCRDLALGHTEAVTLAPVGDRTLDASTFSFSVSTNGRFFAFATSATNVVGGIFNTARTTQIYWRDRLAQTNALVTINRDGAFAAGNATLSDLSTDGRFVCFQSPATNIVADQNDSLSTLDLFIRDMFLGETWLVSRTTNNTANGTARGGQFSANGRVLLFSASNANLVPGVTDVNGANADIFAHYLNTRSNLIISASSQGNTGANRFTGDSFARLSATGKYVLFTSTATNLITGPPAPQRLYLRDLEAGRTLDPLRSFFPTPAFNEARIAIAERDIFFMTQTNFDQTIVDANNAADLFRAPLYQPKFLSARPMVVDALPNTTYVLQSSIDLGTWFNTFTNVSDANGHIIYNLYSTSPIHFHRLLWP